jgi:type III pantothenate kinase
MLLCDIGNTSYHFLEDGIEYKKDAQTFDPSTIKEEVHYNCVNTKIKLILKDLENWIDLSGHLDMSKYYETMGVDRMVASEAIKNGIIIDAGSAVTVDIVKDGLFQGGFIYPGLNAMSQTYKNISSALDYPFNFDIDLNKFPKNSTDAITYGYLKTLYAEVTSHNMNIILTGGDAKEFAKIFPDAKVNESLIFKGMKKLLQNR